MPNAVTPGPSPHAPLLGGRYRLVEPVAEGGMGRVWTAQDEILARPVAVKVLAPLLANDPGFVERFRREAIAAAGLTHPNIVAIFDAAMDRPEGEAPYIVMELVCTSEAGWTSLGVGSAASALLAEAARALPGGGTAGAGGGSAVAGGVGRPQWADVGRPQWADGQAGGPAGHHEGGATILLGGGGDYGTTGGAGTDATVVGPIPPASPGGTDTTTAMAQPAAAAGSRHETAAGPSRHETAAGPSRHEAVAGLTVRHLIDRAGAVRPDVVVAVGIQVANALAYAHRSGIIHRDIKPGNILLGDVDTAGLPAVKVADFGIAKAAEIASGDPTRTGLLLGTPRYLSPEQLEGRDPTPASDLYALGVVLYEMLIARPPFDGPTDLAVALAHLHDEPPDLRTLRPDVSAELAATIARTLARNPAARPPSAAALADALASIPAVSSAVTRTPALGGPAAAGATPVAGTAPAAGRAAWDGGAGQAPRDSTMIAGAPVAPRPPTPGRHRPAGRRRRRRRGATPLTVAVLVLVALLVGSVVAAVKLNQGSSTRTATPGAVGGTAKNGAAATGTISGISVFHLERDADHAGEAGNAIDGNPSTAWHTDIYRGPRFAGLRNGLGLALTLDSDVALRRLTVLSPTSGWTAAVYLASRPATTLAGWGNPVATGTGTGSTTTFDLHGRRGRAVLLWLTDLGPTDQAAIAELTLTPA